ncbi:small ribosomal subunit protein mS40 [Neocloeon triangulifer]|uniref:small ribosomal subunit protein mS40 n=1 Tax=Neocloeon triangulifer TaxID=2078957 RepID=UPI00286EBCA0|nr:small ribosomal subunit protein mS40 [Neocloeon triangulifer]
MAARGLLFGISRLVSTRFSSTAVFQRPKLTLPQKSFHTAFVLRCEATDDNDSQIVAKQRDPTKARDQVIPVETSIEYLESEAYQITYGANPVWKEYRRNFKGHYPPPKTRKTCIRQEEISTGNPCPICRDEYLVLDYRNIKLLQQFICPHTGAVLSYSKTGLCQKKHRELLVAVERARDCGFLTFDVQHREYNYSEYIKIKQ